MAQDTPSRKLDQYIVRMPEGMRELLKAYAEQNQRSLNAEIVSRLLETLEPWKPGDELTLYEASEGKSFPTETYDLGEVVRRLEQVTDKLRGKIPRD